MKLGDIKDKVILIDYEHGCHGNFLSTVLYKLIYDDKEKTSSNLRNYHDSNIPKIHITSKLCEQMYVLNEQININDININQSLDITLPICFPLHYSNCDNIVGNDSFKTIGIYVDDDSWLRQYINSWFNADANSSISTEQIKDNDFFVQNFIKLLASHQPHIEQFVFPKCNIHHPNTHQFTKEEVLKILVLHITDKHNGTNEYGGGKFNSNRIINANYPVTMSLSHFYSLDSFVHAITNIRDTFGLQFEIDVSYLQLEWELFILKNHHINMNKIKFGYDSSLHLIEQAYSIFLANNTEVEK